jgi:Xaa-Pro aminopeptidase
MDLGIENLKRSFAPPAPSPAPRTTNAFETLTLAPIDRRLIVTKMLRSRVSGWLTSHVAVVETRSPLLDSESRLWLAAATRPLAP